MLAISFTNVLTVSTRVNYLMAMKELEIKVTPGISARSRSCRSQVRQLTLTDPLSPDAAAFHASTISRQAPFKLEYIDGLIETDRVLFERLIVDSIPSRVAEPSRNSDIL